MLALPTIDDSLNVIEQLKLCHYSGSIAGIARYADERERLLAAGADTVFSYFLEVGAGFAEEGKRLLQTA